jgi:hypothetical protein
VYPQPLYPPPDCPKPTGSVRNVAEYIHEDVVWTQPAGDLVEWYREDYHEVKQEVVHVKEEVVHIKEEAIYVKEEGVY